MSVFSAFDISTTALVAPPITVCFALSTVDNATFGTLNVLHGENGALVDRTISSDASTGTLCAETSSLSPFVIAVRDTIPPTLTVNDVTATATDPAGAIVDFASLATDNHGDATVVCSRTSGTTFAIGETTVSCTATDAAGNHTTATFVVPALDGVPPVLSVPDSQTLEATSRAGAGRRSTPRRPTTSTECWCRACRSPGRRSRSTPRQSTARRRIEPATPQPGCSW